MFLGRKFTTSHRKWKNQKLVYSKEKVQPLENLQLWTLVTSQKKNKWNKKLNKRETQKCLERKENPSRRIRKIKRGCLWRLISFSLNCLSLAASVTSCNFLSAADCCCLLLHAAACTLSVCMHLSDSGWLCMAHSDYVYLCLPLYVYLFINSSACL